MKGVSVILNETTRLSGLVEELLDFSRLQSGNFKINMMTVEVMPILTEAVSMYNQLAKKQGKGAVSLRGKMIDAPIVARAKQVLEAAEAMKGGR